MMLSEGRSSRWPEVPSAVIGCQMRKIIVRDGMSFIGLCFSVAGLCTLGYQFLCWLKSGSWPPLAFRLVLGLMGAREPTSPSQGIEQIGVWMFALPLSSVLIVSGFAVMTVGVAITAGSCDSRAANRDPRDCVQF
jgi:hypothetical protein